MALFYRPVFLLRFFLNYIYYFSLYILYYFEKAAFAAGRYVLLCFRIPSSLVSDTSFHSFGYRLSFFQIPLPFLSDTANVFRYFSAAQSFYLASLKTARKCLFVAFFGLCVEICRIFRKFPIIFGFFLKCLYFSFIFAFFLLFLQVFCV